MLGLGWWCLGRRRLTLQSWSSCRKARKYRAKWSALLILRFWKERDYKRRAPCLKTSLRRYSCAELISHSEYSLNCSINFPYSSSYFWLLLAQLDLPPSNRQQIDRLLLCDVLTKYYHSSLAMLDLDRLEFELFFIFMQRFRVVDRCFWKLWREEAFFLEQNGSYVELEVFVGYSGLAVLFGSFLWFWGGNDWVWIKEEGLRERYWETSWYSPSLWQ